MKLTNQMYFTQLSNFLINLMHHARYRERKGEGNDFVVEIILSSHPNTLRFYYVECVENFFHSILRNPTKMFGGK
jgi:hypothetical protein